MLYSKWIDLQGLNKANAQSFIPFAAAAVAVVAVFFVDPADTSERAVAVASAVAAVAVASVAFPPLCAFALPTCVVAQPSFVAAVV